MPNLGPAEILVVFVVALLLFGPDRLPEIGRQVARAMNELRRMQESIRGELNGVFDLDEDEGKREGEGVAESPRPSPIARALPTHPADAEIPEEPNTLDPPHVADLPGVERNGELMNEGDQQHHSPEQA